MDAEQTVEAGAVAADLAISLGVIAASTVLSVVVYLVIFRSLFRLRRAEPFAEEVIRRCRWPARSSAAVLGAIAGLPVARVSVDVVEKLTHLLLIVFIVAFTITALRFAVAIEVSVLRALDLDAEDNALARGRTTQVILARRVATAVVTILAIGGVLLTFDQARSIGTSLLASAGIIGLVAGVAAQSTIGNMIAGIQLAVTESLRIDDVVVVEGEWGNVEEVGLTYVIVRIWDRRRLVLPTSYFVNTPFQNWTRRGSQVIGTIFWEVDHRLPISLMRKEFHARVEAHPLWDGDVAVLQVTDVGARTVQVRGLVTGKDSGTVWDLRCAVRESLLGWIAKTHPEGLPATRLLEAPAVDVARRPPSTPPPQPRQVTAPGPSTAPRPDPTRTGEWPARPGT